MAWKPGPLPSGTYFWGAVVPVGTAGGFYFADFMGDHVIYECSQDRGSGLVVQVKKVLKPDEVAWYDNSIVLPPIPNAKRLP